MRVDNSTGKGTSGMDKFSSEVHRVHMELGGRLLDSLRIRTQFLKRLQIVSVVDGATHTQKDDVESNGGSLENVAEIFMLFLFFLWCYSYCPQGPDRQQKKRGGRAQAEEKARGSCSRRPRTRERKPGKRKGPK